MKIRIGYELVTSVRSQPLMILCPNVHFSRISDMLVPDHLICQSVGTDLGTATPSATGALASWRPRGQVRLSTDALVTIRVCRT